MTRTASIILSLMIYPVSPSTSSAYSFLTRLARLFWFDPSAHTRFPLPISEAFRRSSNFPNLIFSIIATSRMLIAASRHSIQLLCSIFSCSSSSFYLKVIVLSSIFPSNSGSFLDFWIFSIWMMSCWSIIKLLRSKEQTFWNSSTLMTNIDLVWWARLELKLKMPL